MGAICGIRPGHQGFSVKSKSGEVSVSPSVKDAFYENYTHRASAERTGRLPSQGVCPQIPPTLPGGLPSASASFFISED